MKTRSSRSLGPALQPSISAEPDSSARHTELTVAALTPGFIPSSHGASAPPQSIPASQVEPGVCVYYTALPRTFVCPELE